MDSGLTLEAAKKAIRQREAVHEQQQTLNGSTDVDAVGFQRKARPKNRPATRKSTASYDPEMWPLRQRTASTGQEMQNVTTGLYGAMCRKKNLSVATKTTTNRPSSRE